MRPADFKNVSIVAHYIKERTRDAQFIIISLRNNMFELADRLVRLVMFLKCGICEQISTSNSAVLSHIHVALMLLP